jgi:hypothetical protein
MRIFLFTLVALTFVANQSDAGVARHRLQEDDSEQPTPVPLDTPVPVGGEDDTPAPTGDEGATPTPSAEEGGDGVEPVPGSGNVTPAPAPGIDDTTPMPVEDGAAGSESLVPTTEQFPGDDFDTPAPTPVAEVPTYDEPTYDEPTYDEPTYDGPTYDEPTYDGPTYDIEPTYDEPTYDSYPAESPAEKPQTEYVAADDDPLEPITEGDGVDGGDWEWDDETIDELEHNRTALIALSVVGVFGILLAIVTAQQMSEKPDGWCARYVS